MSLSANESGTIWHYATVTLPDGSKKRKRIKIGSSSRDRGTHEDCRKERKALKAKATTPTNGTQQVPEAKSAAKDLPGRNLKQPKTLNAADGSLAMGESESEDEDDGEVEKGDVDAPGKGKRRRIKVCTCTAFLERPSPT